MADWALSPPRRAETAPIGPFDTAERLDRFAQNVKKVHFQISSGTSVAVNSSALLNSSESMREAFDLLDGVQVSIRALLSIHRMW
jgi:hypothetical protein